MIGLPKSKKKHPPPKGQKKSIKLPKELIEKIDVPRIVCIHLIGENHSMHHRMGVGVIIMTIGVLISKVTAHIYIISFFGEIFGYLIHGIGSIPFVDQLSSHLQTIERGGSYEFDDSLAEEKEEEGVS